MRLSSTVAIALVASTIGAMESARSQVPAQTEHCAGRPPGPGPSHPKGERWLRGGEVSEGPSGVAVKGGARLVVDGYDICADTLTYDRAAKAWDAAGNVEVKGPNGNVVRGGPASRLRWTADTMTLSTGKK